MKNQKHVNRTNSVMPRLLVMGLVLMWGLLAAIPPIASAATYTYTPTNTATESWSGGANWSAVPASASDTILTFMRANSTVLPNSTTNFNNNDVANPFNLNVLNLQGTGPASGAGNVTIGGTALRFVNNGSSTPVVNLNALAGTAGLNYTNNAPITLATNITVTGDGTAGFVLGGAISGSGAITKYGASTLQLNGDSSSTFSGPINLRGGTLTLNGNRGGKLPATQVVNFDGVSSMLSLGAGGTNTFGAFNYQRGGATIYQNGSVNLWTTASAWSRSTGATVFYNYANGSLGGSQKIVLAGQPTGFIDGGTYVKEPPSTGFGFAFYDAAGYVRAINYTSDSSAQNVSGDFTASDIGSTAGGVANKHTQITNFAGTAIAYASGGAVGGNTLTLASAGTFQVGQPISGTGIIKGSFITAIAGSQLTLSQNLNQQAAGNYTPYSGINNQSSITLNTLKFANTAAGSLRLAAGQTLTLSDGGIIADGGFTPAVIISGGAGIQAGLNKELVVIGNALNNMLVIASPILANGVNALVRNGPSADINSSFLRLEGANTFTGGVYLNGNAIQLASAETPGVSGPLGVGGTIYFYGGQLFPTAINTYDYSPRFATTPNQNFSVDTSGGSVTWAANLVSDNGTLTYKAAVGSSGGSLTLTGTNTYSGGTTFTGPTLILGSDSALGTGPVSFNNTAASYVRNNSATATRTLRNALAINTTFSLYFGVQDNGNIGSLVFTGPVTLGVNASLMAGSSGTTAGQTAVGFEGAIGDNGAGNTLTVPGSSDGKGAGFVFLLGTNTYSGQTTVASGGGSTTVIINSLGNAGVAGSLGASTGANATIRVAAGGGSATKGTLRYIGGITSTDRTIDMASTASTIDEILDASGSGPITFPSIAASGASGAATSRKLSLTGGNTNANTISGAIPAGFNGNMKVEKNGNGTWVLSGANTFTNGLTINSGRLVLDHANNAIVVNVTNAITLGDLLEIKGNASTATTPALGNLTLNSTCLSKIILTRPGSAALGVTLGNTWAFGGSGSTLFIDLSSGATLACNPASQMNNGDIAYAVVKDSTGTGFAMTDGANIVRYTGGTALTASSSSTTTNFTLSGNLTMATGSKNIYTLAVDTTGGGTLDLNGITLTANRNATLAGGLLFTGTGNYTITNGIYAGAPGYYSFIHQYSTGIVTLSAQAGGTGGSAQFLKDGPGTLVLGNRAFTGALRIFEGAVRADNANVLTIGAIQVNNGGVLELGAAGNFSGALGTSAGNIQFSGDGGFSAYGGTRTVQLNGGTATIAWGSSNFVPDNNALVLGAKDANDTLDFQNGLDLGNFQRVVDVKNGSAAVDGRLSGVLTGRYGGGLIKRGAGTLELTGANTYQGDTWVEGGELKVSGSTGSGLVAVSSGASISGTGTVNRLTLNSGGKLFVADATKPLTVTGVMNVSNGTLDLAGLGTLPDGDLTIVNCGSIVGSSFGSVINTPPGRQVQIVGTTISLKDTTPQGFMLIVR